MAHDEYKPGRKRGPSRRVTADGHDALPRDQWQLGGGDYALVWRGDKAQLVPLAGATKLELSSGVASIEALACYVLDSFLRSKHARLTPDRRQDAIAFLIEQAWIEGQRFNGAGRLGGFVTSRLRWRLLDWYRVEFERRDEVEVMSMDVDEADMRRIERAAERNRREGVDPPFDARVLLARDMKARDEAMARPMAATELVDMIDVGALSEAAHWTLVHVVVPMVNGVSMLGVCQITGRTRKAINEAMDELRAELTALGVAP